MYRVNQVTMLNGKALTADFTSPVLDVSGAAKFALEIGWAGINSVDSTIKLEGSSSGILWCDVGTSATYTISTTGTGDKMFDFPVGVGYNKIRLVYTKNTNSAGTMGMIGNLKFERNGDAPGAP